jgi:electron transport complex protein RnfE
MSEPNSPEKIAERVGEQTSAFKGSKQTTLGGLVADGILAKNPVFVLALSLCPAVAVTTSVKTSLAMGLAVLFVISFNNLFTSLLRRVIHPKVRMPAFILLIATLVTTTELFMSAFFPALYREMGVYLKLVVVFAIILARAEVFASKNPPIASFMDGFGMGVGFLAAMVVAGVVRELLGTGAFWGHPVFGSHYQPILIVVLAPGGFITIGLLIALFRTIGEAKERARAKASPSSAPVAEASHA